MRSWTIRITIVLVVILMNVLESIVLRKVVFASGFNPEATLIDEVLLGFVMGVALCFVYDYFRRRYERKLQAAVDELNHHVRNSMQVILNTNIMCEHCSQEEPVSRAMERVDWALREIIPPEMQPKRK